ncbi:MAG: C1 family peptidase, partial [Thermoflexibacteraceae bacterium]
KSVLAEGYPIAFGIELFESFDKVRRDGRVKLPNPQKEQHVGGHAMLCVGYLEKDQVFIVRNSWGEDWGDKGYCYVPYEYVLHSSFNDGDNWVIKNVTDLDFGKEVAIEDDESYFYDEGTLVIYDYYIRTKKIDTFLEKLEKLAEKYAADKDWGFEIREDEEDETLIYLDDFFVEANDANGFLDELNVLSEKIAIDDDYDFQYVIEGEDFEDEETAAEKDEALSEEEEETAETSDNEDFVELYDFYIKTQKIDAFSQKIEELCNEYAVEGDFDYEVFEDEEEDNVFWFETFFISTQKPKEFLATLDKLCSQYAVNNDFDYEA